MSYKLVIVLALTGIASAYAESPRASEIHQVAAAHTVDCGHRFDQKAMSSGSSSLGGESNDYEAAIQAAIKRRMGQALERGGRVN